MPKLTNFRCRIKFATRNHKATLLAHPITVAKSLPTSMTSVNTKMDIKDKRVTLDPDKPNQLTLSDNFCNVRYLNQDNLCNVNCLNHESNFCNVRYLNQAEDNQEKTVQDDISEDNLEDSSDDDKDEFVFDKAVNNTLKGSNQSNIRLNKANSAF